MIKEGQQAPDFALTDSQGKVVKLSDFLGKQVVLYFYPKDMTPGCTKEACGFRDYYTHYQDKKTVILGVSLDSEDSHRKFTERYGLPFLLLSDTEGRVARLYHVYQKKKIFGKEFFGIKRVTFLIDTEGKIRKIFNTVSVNSHHRDVFKTLE